MSIDRLKTLIISVLVLLAVSSFLTLPAHADNNAKRPFTVVIDAGHGGRDPGAQGFGVNEKDINLAVALKLGEFIKKNLKSVRVLYTRDKDVFVPLQERTDKANKAAANLFISIHVNSLEASNPRRASVSGASVHVMGPSKDGKNMEVVRRENSVIKLEKNYAQRYQGFDPDSDESYIIFEMMQKRNLQRSLDLAQEMQKQLTDVAARKSRGVTQDPFWVLWANSCPAVLVELDFICNPTSVNFMNSTQGQNKLAKALFNAVRTYYTQELNAARQPAPQPHEVDEIPSDGRVYVGDGYAVIGHSPSPERTVRKSNQPCTPARRQRGERRRSAAAREVSAQRTLVQPDVTVRTHAEVADIAHMPKARNVAPVQSEPAPRQPAAPKKEKKKKVPKSNVEHRPGSQVANVPAAPVQSSAPTIATGVANNAAAAVQGQNRPAKEAKVNRKRGQRAVVVMQTAQDNQPSRPAQSGAQRPEVVVAPQGADRPAKQPKANQKRGQRAVVVQGGQMAPAGVSGESAAPRQQQQQPAQGGSAVRVNQPAAGAPQTLAPSQGEGTATAKPRRQRVVAQPATQNAESAPALQQPAQPAPAPASQQNANSGKKARFNRN